MKFWWIHSKWKMFIDPTNPHAKEIGRIYFIFDCRVAKKKKLIYVMPLLLHCQGVKFSYIKWIGKKRFSAQRRIQFEQTMKKRFHGWRILGPVSSSSSPSSYFRKSGRISLLKSKHCDKKVIAVFSNELLTSWGHGSSSWTIPFPISNVLIEVIVDRILKLPVQPTDCILQQLRKKWLKNTSALIRENNPWEFCPSTMGKTAKTI